MISGFLLYLANSHNLISGDIDRILKAIEIPVRIVSIISSNLRNNKFTDLMLVLFQISF